MSRPRIFIGSSKESIEYAKAVQSELLTYADAVLWKDANFTLGSAILEDLVKFIQGYDFAVFILSEDDQLNYRGEVYSTTRDNVVFEYGLFMGKLGRFRVFALTPNSNNFHLLTDLHGIITARYDPPNCAPPSKPTQEDLKSAVRPACVKIREQIEGGILLKDQTLLEQISADIRVIAAGTSTKYLGRFPDFFEEHILPSVEGCKEEILIACDFPSYGLFSAQKVHLTYMKLLRQKKSDGCIIKTLFLNEKLRRDVTSRQMPKSDEEWEKELSKPAFAKRLTDFCDHIAKPISNWQELERELNKRHAYSLTKFKTEIVYSYEPVDSPMPIYLWIIDNSRAIFSLPHFGVEPTEHGFETTNPDLVRSLQRLWDRYKEKPISESIPVTT